MRTSRAPCTCPPSTATTPLRPRGARDDAPHRRRFCGPSGSSAVAGRIAAVSTTGLTGASTRCRNHAVSSSVSVPCVMTIPATSGLREVERAAQRERAPDRVIHVLAVELGDLLDLERHAGQCRHAREPVRRRRAARRGSRCCPTGPSKPPRSCRPCRARRPWSSLVLHFSESWMKIQVLDGCQFRAAPAVRRKTAAIIKEIPCTKRPSSPIGNNRSSTWCKARSNAPVRRRRAPRSPHELGFKSANAAEEHLQALARKGVIELVGGTSRGIRLRVGHAAPAEPARGRQFSAAAAQPRAADAAAGRPRRGGQPDPGPGAHRPDLPGRSQHVPAPPRLPAEGARHEHARRRHHGRRPARGAEARKTRRTARSSSPASATRSPSSASGAPAPASS